MKRSRFQIIGAALILVLLACESESPNLDRALQLFNEGQINHARLDFVRSITDNPDQEEVQVATQHVHLIRKIKAREAEAVRLWMAGDLEGTRRTIGIIRFLHPVYVDTSGLAKLPSFPPPAVSVKPLLSSELTVQVEWSDTVIQQSMPYSLALLACQESFLIDLAHRWETLKYQKTDSLQERLSHYLSTPGTIVLLEEIDSLYQVLRAASPDSSSFGEMMAGTMEIFHQYISYLKSAREQPLTLYEYELHRSRGDLLKRIVVVRAQLAGLPER